jgi:glutamate/aspartate transport system substrate-binding protein
MERALSKCLRTFIAVCLTLPAMGTLAADISGGTLKAIKDRNAVVIGYLSDAYPMSFLSQDGQPAGFSIDLCRAIAADAGKAAGLDPIGIQYVPVTLDGRFDAVATGEVDIECGTSTITLSRMRKVDFTNITFLDGGSLLVKKSSAIGGIPALVDETVAVIPGTTTEKSLRDALTKSYVNAKVVDVKSHAEGMAALELGKVTAYASDRVLLVGLLAKVKNPESFAIAPEQFSYEPYGFAVRRDDADFRLVANTTLARLCRSGEVLKIFDRWFGSLGTAGPALIMMYLVNATPE